MTDEQYTWQIAAYLLSYPDEEWRREWPAVKAGLAAIADDDWRRACTVIADYIDGLTPREYEDEYVRIFDFSGNTNMYLASYDCSDAGEQSKKLLEYKAFFEDNGFTPDGELPDYVPALLELCAALPESKARAVTAYAAPALSLLEQRLKDGGHSQARLIGCIVRHGRKGE